MKKCVFYRTAPPPHTHTHTLGVNLLIVNYLLGKPIRSFTSVDDPIQTADFGIVCSYL